MFRTSLHFSESEFAVITMIILSGSGVSGWVWLMVLLVVSGLESGQPTNYSTTPLLPLGTGDYDSEEDLGPSTTSEPLPSFSPDNPRNITVHLGATAFLHCRVTLLHDKTVSWVKGLASGQVVLLTTGLHTFSHDPRLSINFQQPDNWKLRIAGVEGGDQGNYICQVSSHPPIAMTVNLNVIVPRISLVDDLGRRVTDKYYNSGSTVELRCVITHLPPSYNILWHHHNLTLNYNASRGGISVKTTMRKEGAVSVLYIAHAKSNDSGPYTCSLGNLTHNTILVHVMTGEAPAAMQHSNGAPPTTPTYSSVLIFLHFFLRLKR